jgi:DNA-binding LytR/AlgR family response regulator
MNNFLSQQISEIVRVHRSFAVNISFINNITANEVVLSNTSIPLSRKYRNELTEKFQK